MKLLIKNKRAEGDLLSEETLKLIFSIIAISFLLLLAGKLFYMFVKPNDIRKADATLDEIIQTMDRLNGGEVGRIIVTGPKDWYLFYSDGNVWAHNQSRVTPTSDCNGNCLCICVAQDEDYVIIVGTAYGGVERGTEKYHVADCNEGGICKNLKKRDIKLTDSIRTGLRIDVFELGVSFSDGTFDLYRA